MAQHRERLPHRRDTGRELRIVHEHHQIGILEQIAELGLDVAIVDVDRDRAQLVRREDRLDELVTVEAVDADVIPGSHALGREVMRQPVRALLQLRVRARLVGDDEGDPIGNAVDNVFGEICDVPRHGWQLNRHGESAQRDRFGRRVWATGLGEWSGSAGFEATPRPSRFESHPEIRIAGEGA